MLDPALSVDKLEHVDAAIRKAAEAADSTVDGLRMDARSEGLANVLARAGCVFEPLGDAAAGERRQLEQLGQRLGQGQFHLAVLGQFKRGKSTFLNALLGDPILPTSVVPLTAIPTFIRHGKTRRVDVLFRDGKSPRRLASEEPHELSKLLGQFVSEQANPENRLAVEAVSIEHPAAILRDGLVLIDTPGIGSTYRHNTEVTVNFLPQCDAAVFLVSADPPITEVEVDFLRQVQAQVRRLFFVFNKVDYLSRSDVESAVRFLQDVLRGHLGGEMLPRVFPASARKGLESRMSGARQAWTESGMAAVQDYLLDFLASEKSATLRAAIASKAANVLDQARMQVELVVKTMKMPLADLETRQAEFRDVIDHARHQRVTTADLLAGEQRRAAEHLESQAERLRRRTRRRLVAILRQAQASPGEKRVESVVEEAMAAAIPPLFEKELGDMSREFTEYVNRALKPYQQQADQLIENVRRQAAELFEISYRPLRSESIFATAGTLYWETHSWHAHLGPIPPEWMDRFLPATIRKRRTTKRLMCQIETLVVHNVERLRWPTRQSLDATFRQFADDLDQRLQDTVQATYGAIQAAAQRRGEHAAAVTDEIHRLSATCEQLREITAELES